jgi:putative ABC transport system permease protein
MLGVTLVAATGSLYRIVNSAMQADTRALLGGDVEVDTNTPLPEAAIQWMNDRGKVTLVRELYTMLGNADGHFIRVELQSMDENYPLYGELELSPAMSLSEATRVIDNSWGLAIDESLSQRHNISVGDRVFVGELEMTVRAIVISQPDRNLTAQWRGAPVLVADNAIDAAGLTGPGSRIDYDYKVATDLPAEAWRDQFYRQFSDEGWEVRTFQDRSERIAERLGQIASGLMIIAFSTLFIGGLGVFSSVRTHLQGKLKTIATLRSLGLRNGRLATVYLLQVAILSLAASIAGCVLGGLLAWGGATVVASELRLTTALAKLPLPLTIALLFGCLTAFTFALPAIGRALSVSPATLFRSNDQAAGKPSKPFIIATTLVILLLIVCIVVSLPDPLFAIGFIIVVLLLLAALEVLLVAIRKLAKWIDQGSQTGGSFSLRLAMANLHRPESPLRSAMLSLGSALTVLVACTLVVTSLLRTVYATIPESAPALVLYDIETDQVNEVEDAALQSETQARIETAPLVRARITSVNEVAASQLIINGDNQLRRAINNEHKLSYRGGNIDGLDLIDGQWWAPGTTNVMSLEDREAGRLGIKVGDRISYQISDKTLQLEVRAIHTQKGLQTRFWFEGIVANNLLDGLTYRHVGTAFMSDEAATEAQKQIAALAPNVITVRTARLLATARDLLGQATTGLLIIAGVSLLASLLVLISVIAAGRNRQIYEATVLNTLGARISVIHNSLRLEFLLLAIVTTVFAVALGSAIALPLLEWRMKLPSTDLLWVAVITAGGIATIALGLGARYVRHRLDLKPAILLRDI